jgi:hypothetical protein
MMPAAGEQLFDLAAQVRGVPRRPRSTQPSDDFRDRGVPVQRTGHR